MRLTGNSVLYIMVKLPERFRKLVDGKLTKQKKLLLTRMTESGNIAKRLENPEWKVFLKLSKGLET